MDTILLSNITLDGKQVDILISDGLISKISPNKTCVREDASGVEYVDCSGKVAMPGFINLHTHAAMTLLRGIGEDMALKDWLDHIWEIESRLTPEFVYWGTKVAALEMIKTGTTAFNDQYWFSLSAQEAATQMGLRSAISYVFLDKMDPEEAKREKDQCIELAETVPKWGKRAMFTISVHSVYTVSENLILWAVEYARSHGLRIHMHLAESEQEDLDCKAAHGGLSPVQYLDRLGVLGPDLIAAHTQCLSDDDIALLGKHQVNCVHNVNSNAKLASGCHFKWKELSEAGANVCLGTDGCASSNNLDMLEAMKTAAIFQKAWRKDPSALPLEALIKMATVNGAKALGLKSGLIKEGYEADIQIIDTDSTFFLSPGPFLANYVYSAHSDCVSSLIAGGRFVMRERNVTGEKDILMGARCILESLKNKTL